MKVIENGLSGLIEKNNNSINQYNADLEKYHQEVDDAKKAKKIFEQSWSNMNRYIYETAAVFEGAAAQAFTMKLIKYNDAINSMVSVMENRIKNLEKRIKEVESQRGWCEFWNNVFGGFLNILKIVA